MIYNPSNWYWSGVPGIYGSARGGLVTSPTTDAPYLAWQASGGSPTAWPKDETGAVTTAALDAVLVAAGLPASGLTPPTKPQLQAYANGKAQSLVAAMKSYGASAPILKADRTAATISDMIAIEQDAQTEPNDVYNWVANDNSVTVFTATQIAALAPSVAMDRKAIFAILASAMTGIATGTITTTAQVDALAWPT